MTGEGRTGKYFFNTKTIMGENYVISKLGGGKTLKDIMRDTPAIGGEGRLYAIV